MRPPGAERDGRPPARARRVGGGDRAGSLRGDGRADARAAAAARGRPRPAGAAAAHVAEPDPGAGGVQRAHPAPRRARRAGGAPGRGLPVRPRAAPRGSTGGRDGRPGGDRAAGPRGARGGARRAQRGRGGLPAREDADPGRAAHPLGAVPGGSGVPRAARGSDPPARRAAACRRGPVHGSRVAFQGSPASASAARRPDPRRRARGLLVDPRGQARPSRRGAGRPRAPPRRSRRHG